MTRQRIVSSTYLFFLAIFFITSSPCLFSSFYEKQAKYLKYFESGLKAQKKNNYIEAIKWYNKSIKEKNDFPDSWGYLGKAYGLLARHYLVQSELSFNQALLLDPSHEFALESQGQLYILIGELQKARDNLEKLRVLNSKEIDSLKRTLDKVLAEANHLLES